MTFFSLFSLLKCDIANVFDEFSTYLQLNEGLLYYTMIIAYQNSSFSHKDKVPKCFQGTVTVILNFIPKNSTFPLNKITKAARASPRFQVCLT